MHIAVIGAGIAGLTAARKLQARGHAVTVYEKNGALGGRMNTRQTEFGGFDNGAQYFTAVTKGFKNEVAAWRQAGLIAPWEGKLVTVKNGAAKIADRSVQRFVAVPAMNALGRQLGQGLDVRTEQLVHKIAPIGKQWILSVESETVLIDASAGPFDAVIVAAPADQAAVLLRAAPNLAEQADKAQMWPCWSLMLSFQEPLDLPYDAAWLDHPRLGWIARDGSKPQRRAGERWVGHAPLAWSMEHIEDEPERARDKMLKAFREATGSHVQPIHAVTHRWRYAQSIKPLGENCLWDGALRIGACGDWFAAGLEGAGRVENAYLSGVLLAEAVS